MSNFLWSHGLQHARHPCPSLSPRVYSNSYALSQWCHPIISSSVTLFSSCPQSFPALRSFPNSWLLTSSGQSIGALASVAVLPKNIRVYFLWDWLIWSPCNARDSQESSPTPQFKIINSLVLSYFYGPTPASIQDYWKATAWTLCTFVGKVMILLLNILSRFDITV